MVFYAVIGNNVYPSTCLLVWFFAHAHVTELRA
jgi:hypothetical protein